MSCQTVDWGVVAGKTVKIFQLKNPSGTSLELINYGATLRAWKIPDKTGNLLDIVLGFDSLEEYLTSGFYLGSTVGRVAGRIRNGEFSLNGRTYQLAKNNGPNHLHGGIQGFSHKIWDAEILSNGVRFSYQSPAGEEGYPGHVLCHVTYELLPEDFLRIRFDAEVAGEATPLNLTNHAYFNLCGEGENSLDNHAIRIFANDFLPVDENCLVTGEILSVEKTPYDLRTTENLGKHLERVKNTTCSCPGGFDCYFCVLGFDGSLRKAAEVSCQKTGLTLETWTSQPGVHFYSSNFLQTIGKGGKPYGKHCSFCLETQGYPDAVNHPHFPSVVVSPGEKYQQITEYRCFNS